MINIRSVNKVYGEGPNAVTALRDINLEVPQGGIYGVVGRSGAGKSTLIRCVNMLETPTSGQVLVDGQDLTQLDEQGLRLARHQIGMIFQHFNLLSSRTVYDNIALPLELMKADSAQIKAAVEPLLELTGLTDKVDHYPSQLSGGQKQRVAIARALATKPKVLLSDEATSALDPHTTRSILELLKNINRELGITILLITHEMEVVKRICDRVALISDGSLIEEDEVGHFFTHPTTALGHEFVETALSQPLPEGLEDRLHANKAPSRRPVIRLTFSGDSVQAPLITQLARQFSVDVSILQAQVEHIQSQVLGRLLAELSGSDEAIAQAMTHLESQPVRLEVLGYVQPV
ncbi:DL-methionine transporter ATP-binding subunit [Terasakiispira papahanaumokuakeensis]|uniref:DL-methionine transporter ATP-binding subunit n=1 Tax=Terasakiispira papahanaumokuakeensis TaxID=197479 RepID=A0A1E2VA29_9GAMM|nr:methionine ABC transporter ATP-binding protein [Terasakiispira papahanaumokuakeensis]ODC03860.1 DL-methionine transporter ATP-binding subunit [Terasakiispira papahanaumokuakeensis]